MQDIRLLERFRRPIIAEMEPSPMPANVPVGSSRYARVEELPDRGNNRTPLRCHRLDRFVSEPFHEIWVVVMPLDSFQPPRFMFALRQPTCNEGTIYHITQDEDFAWGMLLRFDRNHRGVDTKFSSWRGLGILSHRHIRNFFRTLTDVPLRPNNEWLLTLLYRLEQNNFIGQGKTEDWLRADGHYDYYQTFWHRLREHRQVRFLPGEHLMTSKAGWWFESCQNHVKQTRQLIGQILLLENPQPPRYTGDPEAYWAYDGYEGSVLYYDGQKSDWVCWNEDEIP